MLTLRRLIERISTNSRVKKMLGLSKFKLFSLMLIAAALVATFVALVVDLLMLEGSDLPPVRLAVVAPMSGEAAAIGRAVREGVELEAERINREGGIDGRRISVLSFDDGNDPRKARAAAEEAVSAGAVAVIGHTRVNALAVAESVYAENGLATVTLAADLNQEKTPERPVAARLLPSETYEIRFLANYVRNVIGEKTVNILHEASPRGEALADAFDETLRRFGTKVLYRWPLTPGSNKRDEEIAAAVQQIIDSKLVGTLLVIADPVTSARAVAGLRQSGVRNPIVGTRNFATRSFVQALREAWSGKTTVEAALNGTMQTVPMLFDVAGVPAQNFRSDFIDKFQHAPDWLSAYANDGARIVIDALGGIDPITDAPDDVLRARIREKLPKNHNPLTAVTGVNGRIMLNARREDIRTPLMGVYDGIDLISALTQLSPIREEGITNYLTEVIEGRALYVNDRFMYRTNVVYTGARPDKLVSLDLNARIAEIDLTVWFRWRGDFEPQDIVFTNATTDIRLDSLDREKQIGDLKYKAYRVRGKFYIDFSDAPRAYGSTNIGFSFNHRFLARNNLMYVTDVLGMNLARDAILQEPLGDQMPVGSGEGDGGGFVARSIGRIGDLLEVDVSSADPLVELLADIDVLAGVPGWLIERAWISQEVKMRSSQGDPNYVGFGKPAPSYSVIEFGTIMKPDAVRARDIIPSKFFFYIAIFAAAGTALASLLDRKEHGQFWRAQTLGLRIICWPFLLISVGNLTLDYHLANEAPGTVLNFISTFYNIAFWFIPALLLTIIIERFVFVPLELRSDRKIPNVIRMLANLVIYLFALSGVIAFVFDQTLTSLMATTGLTAMIIGLAVQANIANIFSGIVLNIERPFRIGDKVDINSIYGDVVDITWRTTRIQHDDGHMVSVPNSKISESDMHNYSMANPGIAGRYEIDVDPEVEPERVMELIQAVIPDNPHALTGSEIPDPWVKFFGIDLVEGRYVAIFKVRIFVKTRWDAVLAGEVLWQRLWKSFREAGIEWKQPQRALHDAEPS